MPPPRPPAPALAPRWPRTAPSPERPAGCGSFRQRTRRPRARRDAAAPSAACIQPPPPPAAPPPRPPPPPPRRPRRLAASSAAASTAAQRRHHRGRELRWTPVLTAAAAAARAAFASSVSTALALADVFAACVGDNISLPRRNAQHARCLRYALTKRTTHHTPPAGLNRAGRVPPQRRVHARHPRGCSGRRAAWVLSRFTTAGWNHKAQC